MSFPTGTAGWGCWGLLSKSSKENQSQEPPAAPLGTPVLCGEVPAQANPPLPGALGLHWEYDIY